MFAGKNAITHSISHLDSNLLIYGRGKEWVNSNHNFTRFNFYSNLKLEGNIQISDHPLGVRTDDS